MQKFGRDNAGLYAPWTNRRLHFVGIGGAGMSGLALIAAALGASVTGSDANETAYLGPLREQGLAPFIGYRAANVPAEAEVVYSTAVSPENPERATARGTELHRADLLAEISALRRCIAVTGTHGKTTTTAMITHVLRGCGMDPGYAIGGELIATGANAGWGSGEWVVVEADESDRSLLKLTPEIAVLTNAELDHHSTYASLEDLRDTFARFLAPVASAVVWDRPELLALCPPAAAVPYDAAEAELGPVGSRFMWRGMSVSLAVPGAHNAVNAAGALTAAVLAGAEPERAVAAIASFTGARRRLERLGATEQGAVVYDDYAHHPTEVAAMVAAARTIAARRVVAVFQPHLFSRTRALAREFGAALAGADITGVLDVYPARERAEDFPGVSGLVVAQAAADAGGGRPVAWLPDFAAARTFLAATLGAGDLCLMMGAGSIEALAHELVAAPPG